MDPIQFHQQFTNKIIQASMENKGLARAYPAEILMAVGAVKTKKERLAILKANPSKSLLYLLILTYDPEITYTMTKNEAESIEFEPMDIADFDMAPASLHTDVRRLMYFTNLAKQKLSEEKQKRMLSSMLSAMHPEDVKIVYGMFGKKLPYKGLTERLVREAYPGLLANSVDGDSPEDEDADV